MIRHTFEKSLALPRPVHDVFAFHESAGALRKLIPPDQPVRVIEHEPGAQSPIGDGARVVLRLGYWPLIIYWVAVHEAYVPDRQFVDVQVRGPFAFWRHTHSFQPSSATSSVMIDHVEYALPLGWLGNAVAYRIVRQRLEKMFEWRHQVTLRELNNV